MILHDVLVKSTNYVNQLKEHRALDYKSMSELHTQVTIVMKESNDYVVMYNILKIAVFIIIACIEVYMVTSFFKRQEVRRKAFNASQIQL